MKKTTTYSYYFKGDNISTFAEYPLFKTLKEAKTDAKSLELENPEDKPIFLKVSVEELPSKKRK